MTQSQGAYRWQTAGFRSHFFHHLLPSYYYLGTQSVPAFPESGFERPTDHQIPVDLTQQKIPGKQHYSAIGGRELIVDILFHPPVCEYYAIQPQYSRASLGPRPYIPPDLMNVPAATFQVDSQEPKIPAVICQRGFQGTDSHHR